MAALFSEPASGGEQTKAKTTTEIGNFAASPQHFDEDVVYELRTRGFVYLAELEIALKAEGDRVPFCPISLEQLEMVEAELIHQGLLPMLSADIKRGGGLLTFTATRESNLSAWYARRAGYEAEEFSIRIHLPSYISKRVNLLLQKDLSPYFGRFDLARIDSLTRSHLPRDLELSYLNRFARFLLAHGTEERNRYQRGLNLLLKMLLNAGSSAGAEAKIDVILPTTREHLLATLRAHRKEGSSSRILLQPARRCGGKDSTRV